MGSIVPIGESGRDISIEGGDGIAEDRECLALERFVRMGCRDGLRIFAAGGRKQDGRKCGEYDAKEFHNLSGSSDKTVRDVGKAFIFRRFHAESFFCALKCEAVEGEYGFACFIS